MSGPIIHVDEGALNDLKNAFLNAGVDYKTNVAKMEHLVNQIVSGDFQGEAADLFLQKYQEKQDTFKGIIKTLEAAEDKMGLKTTKFNDMMSDIQTNTK